MLPFDLLSAPGQPKSVADNIFSFSLVSMQLFSRRIVTQTNVQYTVFVRGLRDTSHNPTSLDIKLRDLTVSSQPAMPSVSVALHLGINSVIESSNVGCQVV